MNEPWPIVNLSQLLRPVERAESVDALREYRLLGVRWYGDGFFVKEAKLGQEIKAQKVYRVCKGDFAYNRLFAWKGSFAVADSDVDGCYVSNEFPCFEPVDARIDTEFLKWWFRRESVWLQALDLSSGATPTSRNRLKEQHFLAMQVPLPPLAEQRQIVARIEEMAVQIHKVRTLRTQEDQEIKQMLLAAFRRIANAAPHLPMRDVAPVVRRPVIVDPSTMYPELGIRSFGNGTFHKPAVTGMELGNKRVFRIERGDLLFTNVFAWEGAIAVAKPEDTGRVGSHRYVTCVPRAELATSEFLCFYFLTSEGLSLIGAASPGGAGRNRTLGLSALGAIQVPVPPIAQQRWFNSLQAEVAALKRLHTETAAELDALLPAILDRAFKGEL